MHPAILDGFADELVKMATIAQTVATPLRRAAQAAKAVVGDVAHAGETAFTHAATGAQPVARAATQAATQAAVPATRVSAPALGFFGRVGSGVVRAGNKLGLNPGSSALGERVLSRHIAQGAGEAAGVRTLQTFGKGAVGLGATGVGLGGLALHHAGQPPAQAQLTERVTR